MGVIIILAILAGGFVAWRMTVRKETRLHQQRLEREVENPARFSIEEPLLPLPKFREIAMRPELSPEFRERIQEIFGEVCFKTDQPQFYGIMMQPRRDVSRQ